MDVWYRIATGAIAASTLAIPALATGSPSTEPTAVVIRSDGGFSPAHRVVWYAADGLARLDGRLEDRTGHYRAKVTFRDVKRIVAEADLCSRTSTVPQRAAMDVPLFHVSVKCGDGWRFFTTYGVAEASGEPHVRAAAIALVHLEANLHWQPDAHEEPAPDNVGLPAH
jgi:hypothetical protein